MKHNALRTSGEVVPANHYTRNIGCLAMAVRSRATSLNPFQRRQNAFNREYGTDIERRAAYQRLEQICAGQFEAEANSGKVIPAVFTGVRGQIHRLVFQEVANNGQQRILIVDRHTLAESMTQFGDCSYSVSLYDPKDADDVRTGVRVGLSKPGIEMADVRFTKVTRTGDRLLETLIDDPTTSLSAACSIQDNGPTVPLLSAGLAEALAKGLSISEAIHPDFIRQGMLVESSVIEVTPPNRGFDT